jgi:hypothetical protein
VVACLGRWRELPQRAARRKVQKPQPPCGLQVVQQNFKFSWARLFQKAGSTPQVSHYHHQNPKLHGQHSSGFCWIPPVVYRLLKQTQSPNTGARPSVRLRAGLIKKVCRVHRFPRYSPPSW